MLDPKINCSYDELVKWEDLKAHPQNYNKHPQEQIDLLVNIIKETGWRRPVRVSKLSGFITAGHGALLAAQSQGWKVPVDYQDYENSEHELQDLVADNKLAELAETDEKALAELLSGMEDISLAGLIDEIEEEAAKEEGAPEIRFSEVLMESNNFIVLTFDNDVDWLQAQTHFSLKAVDTKRGNGKPQIRGIGRVLNGAEYLTEVAR